MNPDGGTSQPTVLCGHRQDADDNDYATPPEIWRPLARAVDGFDVDPASGAESVPIAETRYTKEDDGLAQAWHGDVWLNPPWSSNGDGSAKDRWLRKARNEANRDAVDEVVVLLPADTSAHWFHEHVLEAEAICLVGPGRIPFEGEDRNPSFQMVIAVYGEPKEPLVDALGTLGAVVRGRRVVEDTKQTLLTDGGRDELEGEIDRRELSKLVSRWRSRAEIFSEDDAVARRTAILCADELEEVLADG